MPNLWQMVLILVVMDDALVHNINITLTNTKTMVLILVVMDDALVRANSYTLSFDLSRS